MLFQRSNVNSSLSAHVQAIPCMSHSDNGPEILCIHLPSLLRKAFAFSWIVIILTPKLNLSALSATISRHVTLTMPTHLTSI